MRMACSKIGDNRIARSADRKERPISQCMRRECWWPPGRYWDWAFDNGILGLKAPHEPGNYSFIEWGGPGPTGRRVGDPSQARVASVSSRNERCS